MLYAILTILLGIAVVTCGIAVTGRATRETAEIMRRLERFVK